MKRVVFDTVDPDMKAQILKGDILEALRDFIGRDPLRRYLAEFIENTANNIQRIGFAIAADDGGRVRHLSHKLKGSSGNIGALKLAWNCVLLEASSAQGDSHDVVVSHYRQLEQVYAETRQAIQSYIDGLAASRVNSA
ncbi:MAG TPA: Hpt domain-containing protein [Gammaproteobacteria bacterium]